MIDRSRVEEVGEVSTSYAVGREETWAAEEEHTALRHLALAGLVDTWQLLLGRRVSKVDMGS